MRTTMARWAVCTGGVVAAIGAVALPAPARAEPEPETPAPAEAPGWTITFEPVVWYVSPGGKFELPGAASTGPQYVSDFNLDSPRLSPAGELQVTAGDWRFAVSGFAFSASNRVAIAAEPGSIGTITYSTNDSLVSDMDFWSFDGTVGYRLPFKLPGWNNPHGPFVMYLEAIGGVRAYDVDFSVTATQAFRPSDPYFRPGPPVTTGGDGFFGEPIVGARLTMEIAPRFTIDAQFSAGGFAMGDSSSWSWDIIAGFAWRPVENVGVLIGYRNLYVDLSNESDAGSLEFRGAMAGLYAGIVLRF